MESIKFCLELRKRKEASYIEFTSEELRQNTNKVLNIMKREYIDLKSWFLVIMYFYSIQDYENFKKFSDELAKIDVDNNPIYKDQKQTFKYILNIFAFYYINFAQKAKDKEKYVEISTSFFNQAERMTMFDPMTMVCKGFIYFAQGNYSQAETYFSNISENDINHSSNKLILILSEIGKGLNYYNKGLYEKAYQHFVRLIKTYDYVQENVLECLGVCYYNMNLIKKAVLIFNKTLEINSKNYKVLVYLAMIKLKDFNYDPEAFNEAFDLIKKAYSEKNETEFDYIFIIFADILLVSGKISEAEEIVNSLNKIIEFGDMKSSSKEIIPNSDRYQRDTDDIKSEIYCLNGNIHHFKSNIAEAYFWYNKAIQANPNNLKAHFGLGQTYMMMENYVEAEKYFLPSKYNLEKDNLLCSNKCLAYIYSHTKKKEYEKIIEMYTNALNFNDQDIDCYLELAIINEIRKPEDSIKMYEKAIDLIRKIDFKKYNFFQTRSLYNVKEIFPEILNNYATIKLRLYQLDNVDKILNEALLLVKKKYSSFGKNQNNKPIILEAVHEEENKFKGLELSILFNIAIYHEAKNEYGEAHTIYRNILKQNSYFIEADVKLGELAKLRGNKEKALEYMKSAIDKHFYKLKDQNNDGINDSNPHTTNLNQINNYLYNQNRQINSNIKLFPFLNKPISQMLMKAQIQFERGAEDEVKQILIETYKLTEGKDPYVLIFMGNFYYDLATQNRMKEDDFKKYMREALSNYTNALELDKYNAYAAIGIANVFSEYSMTDKSLDIYKTVIEKLPNNYNAYANEALILMNDEQFEKAGIIVNKLLKKFYNGKHPKFENIIAKIYIELHDYDKAFKILKGLIMRYPDDLFFRYNYAFCLWTKSREIISKKERRVKETQEAIKNLEKAGPIFKSILHQKNNIGIYLKNNSDEKLLKASDFYDKCKVMYDCIKPNYETCKNLLEYDKIREEETMAKIEENNQKLFKLLQDQRDSDEKKREEIRLKMEDNNRLANELKDQAISIFNTKQNKEKQTKKGKQAENQNYNAGEDLGLNEDDENGNYENEEPRDHHHKKDKKHKKSKHKKKHKHSYSEDDENVDYFEQGYEETQQLNEKKNKKKLRKRKRSFDKNNFREDNQGSGKGSNHQNDSIDEKESYDRENEFANDSNKEENEYNQDENFMEKYEHDEKIINVDQNLVEEDVDYEDN